jgi:hypothetical protein
VKNGTPSHTQKARDLASELEGIDWDEDSSVTIVDAGGRKVRVKTPSNAEIHLDEPTPTKPDNQVPSSVAAPAKGAAHVLKHVTSWQHVAALAIIAALLAFAISKGLALW